MCMGGDPIAGEFRDRLPNPAGIFDHLLGGAHSYAADRDEAGRLTRACPQLPGLAAENRGFTARAVTWMAGQGVTQYLDLGSGHLVAAGFSLAEGRPVRRVDADIHATARTVNPAARAVYVDNDPQVIMFAQPLLTREEHGGAGLAAVEADLRDPAAVLADPGVRAVIDPARPLGIILGLALSLMPATQARRAMAGYTELIAPGSLVVISCFRIDSESLWKEFRAAFTAGPLRNHARDQVRRFLAGLELVPPGLVAARYWRPGWLHAPAASSDPAYILGAVARKPG
jgi:S-adenosyl methyltransferase